MYSDDTAEFKRLLALVGAHDVYHLAEYNVLEAERLGGEFVFYHGSRGDSRLLIPLIRRRVHDRERPHADLAMSYGYPSPLISGDPQAGRALYADWQRESELAGLVSAFVRYNPFFAEPELDTGVITPIGLTVVMDLTLTQEARRKLYRTNHKRDLKKAVKQGLVLSVRPFEAADVEHFHTVYTDTMVRVNASNNYFFSHDYFRALACTPAMNYQLVNVHHDGQLLTSSLFSVSHDVVQYHLSGSIAHPLRGIASKAAIDRAAEMGSDMGCRWLNLGGGVSGREDELLLFKQGFGPNTREVRVSRHVFQQSTYDHLTTARSAVQGSDFFPAYRERTSS